MYYGMSKQKALIFHDVDKLEFGNIEIKKRCENELTKLLILQLRDVLFYDSIEDNICKHFDLLNDYYLNDIFLDCDECNGFGFITFEPIEKEFNKKYIMCSVCDGTGKYFEKYYKNFFIMAINDRIISDYWYDPFTREYEICCAKCDFKVKGFLYL